MFIYEAAGDERGSFLRLTNQSVLNNILTLFHVLGGGGYQGLVS